MRFWEVEAAQAQKTGEGPFASVVTANGTIRQAWLPLLAASDGQRGNGRGMSAPAGGLVLEGERALSETCMGVEGGAYQSMEGVDLLSAGYLEGMIGRWWIYMMHCESMPLFVMEQVRRLRRYRTQFELYDDKATEGAWES